MCITVFLKFLQYHCTVFSSFFQHVYLNTSALAVVQVILTFTWKLKTLREHCSNHCAVCKDCEGVMPRFQPVSMQVFVF